MNRIFPSNFKIMRKCDIDYFLDMCIHEGEVYSIKVREDYILHIEKDCEGDCTVYAWYAFADYGDDRGLKLSNEEAMRTLWYYRKKINEQFFAS